MHIVYLYILNKLLFMQEYIKTISLQASKITWNDVDKRAESTGFKDRSRYIQYLVEKDIYKSKHDYNQILIIVLLLLLALMSLTILLRV